MVSTTRELITSSLRLINVVQPGEVVNEDDMSIAVSAFDQMIDGWSNERLMVYSINPYDFQTVGGQMTYNLGPGHSIVTTAITVVGSSYTNGAYSNVPLVTLTGNGTGALGTITVSSNQISNVQISTTYMGGGYGYLPGDTFTVSNTNVGGAGTGFVGTVLTSSAGDWDVIRPLLIEQAKTIWNDPLSQQAVMIPIELLNDSQYASLSVPNTPSTFPLALYDNGQFPLKTITVFPVPTVNTGIRLWLREPLVDLTNLDAYCSYPPGYERAFRFCLAVEVAPEFGKTCDPNVEGTAARAKEDLKSMNTVPQYMSGDGGMGNQPSTFNWITGNFLPFGPR